MGMLPDEIKSAMQGAIASMVVTCSLDGEPNTTVISHVYYVDADHVALSFQFFNKTIRNVRENPHAYVQVKDPETLGFWDLEVQYDHSEEDGPIFEEMDMKIEAIASMTGMSGIFKLKAADIYKVKSVRKVVENRISKS